MRVAIDSDQFAFVNAEVLLSGRDGPDEHISRAVCRENVIPDLTVDKPGAYNLWLAEVKMWAFSGRGIAFSCRNLLPWPTEFTQDDLDRGTKTVPAPSGDIFRVSVLDRQRLPIPHHKLLLGAEEITTELEMGADGTQLVYGNPTRCSILIDPGIGVLIEHVDLAKL